MAGPQRFSPWMIIPSVLLYGISAVSGSFGQTVLPCLCLIALAIFLYGYFYVESQNLIAMPALFGLFWFGGEGIACLKLSELSAVWNWKTWLALFLVYAGFVLGYEVRLARGNRHRSYAARRTGGRGSLQEAQQKRVFFCIVAMTVLSLGAFLFEAAYLGYIPALIKDTPHAYSYFHVTGAHYFTVSSVMVHPLSVIYLFYAKKRDPRIKWIALCNVIAILIPFLCVSRYFMIMAVALSLLVFLALKKQVTARTLAILGIACVIFLIPVYLILTVFRSHSVSYLNEIFAMKNPNTPIFVTQPYMYIANNYENFNCLTGQIAGDWMFGRRQLFPLFALTGLKFVLPDWMISTIPTYITKEELTTVTILYDAYYDFGLIGAAGFGALLGWACGFLTDKSMRERHNPLVYLFYGQIAMYLVLSFFTTWFSNPTTWFWLILTGVMYVFVEHGGIHESSNFSRRLRHKNK